MRRGLCLYRHRRWLLRAGLTPVSSIADSGPPAESRLQPSIESRIVKLLLAPAGHSPQQAVGPGLRARLCSLRWHGALACGSLRQADQSEGQVLEFYSNGIRGIWAS
jgi:hypothetical protein